MHLKIVAHYKYKLLEFLNNLMELISIPVELFKEKRELLASVEIPTIIQRAIDQLKEKYPMLTHTSNTHTGRHFQNDSRGNFSNHKYTKHNHQSHARRAERPRIGTRELSREDMSRKDFVANMNKLSRQNYDSILRLIRTTYNSNFLSNYMDIIWDLMIRQNDYQDLHIQVIEHLLQLTPLEKKQMVQSYWNDKCEEFFEQKKWTPEGEILTALQSTHSEEYDEFCDYIKWKKRIGASFQAWIRMMIAGLIVARYELCFQYLMEDIEEALIKNQRKYLDCLLEWFLLIQKVLPNQNELFSTFYRSLPLMESLDKWSALIKENQLSSAFRFKLMDIKESYELFCKN